MERRIFLRHAACGLGLLTGSALLGCRGKQYGHVLDEHDADMVGSHTAGAETYQPLVAEAVAKLLGDQAEVSHTEHLASHSEAVPKRRICFVGVENKTIEELGDFHDQLYQLIDTQIVQSQVFQPVNKRYVDAGLRLTRLRPDELFLPQNQQEFAMTMQQQGAPFDFLLFATLTSGTTHSNKDYQRDYMLTLELVDIHSGYYSKQDAAIRKGYHKTRLGSLRHYNPFSRE